MGGFNSLKQPHIAFELFEIISLSGFLYIELFEKHPTEEVYKNTYKMNTVCPHLTRAKMQHLEIHKASKVLPQCCDKYCSSILILLCFWRVTIFRRKRQNRMSEVYSKFPVFLIRFWHVSAFYRYHIKHAFFFLSPKAGVESNLCQSEIRHKNYAGLDLQFCNWSVDSLRIAVSRLIALCNIICLLSIAL